MPDIDSTQEIFNWRVKTITQRSLLGKEMEPIKYLVQGLIITPGLVALAGKKKIGKSWMALQLAQCIASGSPFLDIKTKRGKVVYLALEDGERRLKFRLEKQKADPKLPIRYCTSWPSLNDVEGFKAFIDIITEKTPALVVIDTLASASDRNVRENKAESIGKLFYAFHDLALKANTVILVVAHHGKKSYGDVGFDIRGSSAIPGATDTNMGLYKNSDGSFTLKAEGRDILEAEFRIQFDAETTWTWLYLGDGRDVRRVEAEARILEVIASLGECCVADIAKELGIARPTVYIHLKRMRAEKKVEYEIIETKSGGRITRYKIPQRIGATSPTRLPGKPVRDNRRSGEEGSRQVGEVGAGSRATKNRALTDEDLFTDEDYRELIRELRKLPEGADCLKLIASYLPEES